MNFPEKSKINITQLWPCPPAQPIPDFTVSYPKECEPLLPNPLSSHFCQVGAKCQNPPKIQDQYFFETRVPKKYDTFLNTSTTTKPRDIHIQVRRALLYRVPRNNAMFHNKIQPPMERFHFFLAKIPRFGLQLFWCCHKKPGLSAGKTCVVSAGKTSVVSAAKTSVVSADKRSAVCQDIPQALWTQWRPSVCGQ